MSARNKILILLAVILAVAVGYYFYSTAGNSNLVLVGTVDANQVIVSAKIQGRIEKLTVDEGSEVKEGDLIAVLDSAELKAQEAAAAATLASLRAQVGQTQAMEASTKGSTSSDVANAQALVQSTQAQLRQAQANLEKAQVDQRRIASLAAQGVLSQQDKDHADADYKAAQAAVQSLQDQVRAAQAALAAAIARTHQAHAAASTVAATQEQMDAAQAQRAEAQARLAYTQVYAPVSGIVSVRAARQGEVVNPGEAIVTIVDLNDTWVRAPLPETQAVNIALGDVLRVRLPNGQLLDGRVIFKAPEGDFATQRDVNRQKRDIKTIVLKLKIDNAQKKYLPGMTAEVLVPASKLVAEKR